MYVCIYMYVYEMCHNSFKKNVFLSGYLKMMNVGKCSKTAYQEFCFEETLNIVY